MPDDVAIIGVDHTPLSRVTVPPPTTVELDMSAAVADVITTTLVALGQLSTDAEFARVEIRLVAGGTT